MTMLNLLLLLVPRFTTRYYIHRISRGSSKPSKLTLLYCNSPKFIQPGDLVHKVSYFNLFGFPKFINVTVTRH
mgnify:CR=1 FL=1